MREESVEAVVQDLAHFLNDALAANACASTGLRLLSEKLSSVPPHPRNPDPMNFLGVGDPNEPGSWVLARWRRSELLAAIALNGTVDTQLSQQWVVHFYAGWEEHFRSRLAEAHGCAKDELRVPLMGDLRHLRNDIVHHRGIATREHAARCEILGNWAPGDVIHLADRHFAQILSEFPWEGLTQPQGGGDLP